MKQRKVAPILLIGLLSVFFLFGCGDNLEQSNKGDYQQQEETSWRDNVMNKDFLGDIEKKKVLSITFVDTLEDEPENSWDVSVEQDGSVKAWVEEERIFYHVFIGADGGMCVEDCYELFANIPNISSITFGDCFHTDNVTDMSYMFFGCRKLESLDLSGFCTDSVINMEMMFSHCENLEELDLSSFNTKNVTNMALMFGVSLGLKRIDVSSFDTSKVTDMRGMFMYCENLEGVDVSGFDTQNVTNFAGMFTSCYNLKDLDLRGFYFQEGALGEGMLWGVCEEEVMYQPEQLPEDVWTN